MCPIHRHSSTNLNCVSVNISFNLNVLNLRLKKFFRVIVQPHRNFAKRSDFEDRVIQQTWKWLDNDLRRDARFHERSIKNREKKCGEN